MSPAPGATTPPAPPAPPAPPVVSRDRLPFRADIEGLRAAAVVLVALGHAGVPHLGGGFVGIDMLFVISGFLVTGLLLGQADEHGRVSLADFWARRVRRILPMAALVAIVTTVATYDIAGTAIGNRTAGDAGWAAIFLANVHVAAAGGEALAPGSTPSPLQHYWALSIGQQLSVLWPLLLLVITTLVVGTRNRRRAVLLVVAVVSVLSLAWSVLQTSADPTAAYFSSATRVFELGIGALLAAAVRSRKVLLTRAAATAIAVVGLVLVVAAVVRLDGSTPFPGWVALVPALGVAMVVLGGTDHPANPVSRVLGVAPLRFVGRRSYGFYLWHLPWLVLPTAALGRDPATHLELLLVLGAFLTACVTYALVEDPVRQSGALRESRPVVSLVVGAVLVVSVLGVSQFLQRLNAVPPTEPDAAMTSALPTSAQVVADVAASVGLAAAPADLEPPADAVGTLGALTPAQAACERSDEVTEATDCFLGDTGSQDTIAVWGDSRATMWSPALSAVATQTGKRLAVYAKEGCAPLLGVTSWHPSDDRPYTECTAFADSVGSALRALDPEVVVLTSTSRGWAWSDAGTRVAGGGYTADGGWTPSDAADAVWDAGLGRTISALLASGTEVVVLGDTPYPTQDAGECLAGAATDLVACATTRAAGTSAAHDVAEQQTAQGLGASYVAVTPWFCTDTVCPPVVASTVVHRDDSDLTRQYAVLLARAVGEAAGLLTAADLTSPGAPPTP